MKIPSPPSSLALMDYIALTQVVFGFGFVLFHMVTGTMDGNVWLTGYSMAFGGVNTKLAWETENPKLRRGADSQRVGLMDKIARRGQ